MYYDTARKILWESENGPRGGDELNIIVKGKNYGWPQVTLGRPYDFLESPTGVKTNSLGKSEAPIYGWTPSISPSTVRKVLAGGEFSKYWSGDLLVGSLKGKQLRRLKISAKNTVIYDEPIYVGNRIRSFDILSDGRLLCATDEGTLVLLSDTGVLGTGEFPPKS
jgi:glucose/arabinose dehydrogenase